MRGSLRSLLHILAVKLTWTRTTSSTMPWWTETAK